MPQPTQSLDELIERLSVLLADDVGARDAIDAVLGAPPRATNARSLRFHPDVVRFRRDLADGIVRADTAHRLLCLLTVAVDCLSTR